MRTWQLTISPEECRRHLARERLGRLAVIVAGRPEIFPVAYVFDGECDEVAFPTFEGTKMTGALTWPVVAFEIDGLDENGTGGWSVIVHGHAEEVTEPDRIEHLRQRRGVPWRNELTARWVRIAADEMTGRRISAAPE
jgi:uncharacterized protein